MSDDSANVAVDDSDVVTEEVRIDERVVHVGPIQRMLTRPEVGALLGAIAIWLLFWAVTDKFGTAAATANWLDPAATLGIMSVAVALLMIGGEFDLSSGIMTGATGITLGLIAKEFGDNGLNVFIVVPIVFFLAAVVGWLNAQFVNRTALPSFIVTLGSFFVIKGAVLGYTKRIVDKVLVDDLDETAGYSGMRKIFATEFKETTYGWRDEIFVIGAILGLVILVVGVLELTYIRRATANPTGLLVAVAGVVAGIGGLLGLLNTDGVGTNALFGILGAVGVVAAMAGLGLGRYEPRGDVELAAADADSDGAPLARKRMSTFTLVGVALILLGIALGAIIDSETQDAFLFFFTVQGFRAVAFVGLIVAGVALIFLGARAGGSISAKTRLSLLLFAAVSIAAVAFIVQAMAEGRKFRTEFFTAMLLVATIVVGSAVTEFLARKRTFSDARADRLGRLMVAVGMVMTLLAWAQRTVFTDNIFRIAILWWVLFTIGATFVLLRTRFGNWIQAVGGNFDASRSIGVPAARVKTTLFIVVALAAALVGMCLAFRLNSVQASQGDGQEFFFIIAAVVGGNRLQGGYGSALGAAIGAAIISMVRNGIPLAGWNTNWSFLVLGAFLLGAVLLNNYVREKAEAAR